MNLARSLRFFPSCIAHKQLPLDLSVCAHFPPSVSLKLTLTSVWQTAWLDHLSASLVLAFIWSLHCWPWLCMLLHSCFSPVLLLTRWQDFCGLLLLELCAKCLPSTVHVPSSRQCDQHCMNQYSHVLKPCIWAHVLRFFIEREGIAINPSLAAFIRTQSCRHLTLHIWNCEISNRQPVAAGSSSPRKPR